MFTGVKGKKAQDDLELILDDEVVGTWGYKGTTQEATLPNKEFFINRSVVNGMIQEAYRLGQVKAAAQLQKIRQILKE